MCFNCLCIKLKSIEEYETEIKGDNETLDCECCKSYNNFLLGVNEDLKILCLTKMKRAEQVCPNGIRRLTKFEGMVKKRIQNKLTNCLECIEKQKENLGSGKYFVKMADLKNLSDFVDILDEADHN